MPNSLFFILLPSLQTSLWWKYVVVSNPRLLHLLLKAVKAAMPLKDRIRNHKHNHPPSTLPAWPAGSLSVREVSCCSPGTVQAGVQEWGLYGRKPRVLQDSSGVSISSFPVRVGPCFKLRLEGWGTRPLLLGQRRKNVHTSFVYFLLDLVYWVLIYDSRACVSNIKGGLVASLL